MNLNQRIKLLVDLKIYLDPDNPEFRSIANKAYFNNKWFTEEFIYESARIIRDFYLNEELLTAFCSKYDLNNDAEDLKTIGIVFAGNIPFVGIHDFIISFLSGSKSLVKLSSKDEVLMKYVFNSLLKTDPDFKNYFEIVEQLKDFDAVIATGSNNSSRYFEYYFGKYKNIIRKNRNSIAVLDGNEKDEDLKQLGYDIFNYFGLGCRSISKLYVPKGYDFKKMLKILEDEFEFAAHHNKYKNNYDYQLAILLLNKTPHYVSNNLILLENESLQSPVSVLHYEYYDKKEDLEEKVEILKDEIQCKVSNFYAESVKFGNSQSPLLSDYADNIDTMNFILNL